MSDTTIGFDTPEDTHQEGKCRVHISTNGRSKGERTLEPGTLKIGRDVSGPHDIGIGDGMISRHHCNLIIPSDPTQPPTIEDVGSRNGTKVNGVRIKPDTLTPLTSGSFVQMGATRLIFSF